MRDRIMTRDSLGFPERAADSPSHRIPLLGDRELKRFVRSFLDRRGAFLSLVDREGSPLYAIDTEAVRDKARRFRRVFSDALSDVRVYYALKSNYHPLIASTLVAEGWGLDVSSGRELNLALASSAKDIVFSGPGKRSAELALAVDNAPVVTVLLDSFAELGRLDEIAGRKGVKVRAGVRLTTDESGIWRKFGIPLGRLREFFDVAENCRSVDLCGLQFHISWNLSPELQVLFIARLGEELRHLDKPHRERIRLIDIGGGFWPEQGEWLQPSATPYGMLEAALGEATIKGLEHYKRAASSLSGFSDQIAIALTKYLPQDVEATVCLEPGRWICNEAMHILLTVIDVKAPDVVITDGGTNAVGWERFETDYFPVINLSRPDLVEQECLVAGSLCTPHDIWGYGYFGDGIDVGDILLIPNQGAYTYSLRQEFIKPLPECAELPRAGATGSEPASEASPGSDR